MKKNILCIAVIALISAFIIGCESHGTPNGGGDGLDNTYTLQGYFVQNVNISAQKLDYNDFGAVMTRNDSALQSAQLFFWTTALIYNNISSQYTFGTTPRSYRTPSVITINIVDSTLLADTVSTFVLDSVWITNSPDSSIPNLNGTSVFIEWSAVANSDGYIVAVVHTDSSYQSTGYSAFVTDLSPSTTIPPDAFRYNNTLVPGWYEIYVYAYTGAPDVDLSSSVLPVPLPSQIADNITHTYLTGHFGSLVVSRKKMIQVVSQ